MPIVVVTWRASARSCAAEKTSGRGWPVVPDVSLIRQAVGARQRRARARATSRPPSHQNPARNPSAVSRCAERGSAASTGTARAPARSRPRKISSQPMPLGAANTTARPASASDVGAWADSQRRAPASSSPNVTDRPAVASMTARSGPRRRRVFSHASSRALLTVSSRARTNAQIRSSGAPRSPSGPRWNRGRARRECR